MNQNNEQWEWHIISVSSSGAYSEYYIDIQINTCFYWDVQMQTRQTKKEKNS